MAIIRFLSSTSSDPSSLVRITDYIMDRAKNPVCAIGSTYFPAERWLQSVQMLKALHGKNTMRQYTHGIVSTADDDAIHDVGTLKQAMDQIIHCFEGIPSLYSIHTNTAHIHAHFVNSATRLDGYQTGMSEAMFQDFMNKAGDILESYGCRRPLKEARGEYSSEEEYDMEKFFEIEPTTNTASDDEYKIVIPNYKNTYEKAYKKDSFPKVKVVSVNKSVVQQETSDTIISEPVLSYTPPFVYQPPQVVMEGVPDHMKLAEITASSERNRIVVEHAPEIHCDSVEQAQAFIKQMNAEGLELSQSVVKAVNNGLPCDVFINFNPKMFLGNK